MAKIALPRHPDVLSEDMPAIYAYIAEDNLEEAERVLDAIERTLDLIVEQPECGVIYRTRSSRLRDVRMFPVSGFPQYLVFYKLEPGVAHILYVLHGMRSLRHFFGKPLDSRVFERTEP